MLKKFVLFSTLLMVLFTSAISFADSSLANFRQQKTYESSTFKDIISSDWYYGATKAAFEFGLMGGKAPGVFDPKGNLTLAEAVAIASRVHNVYNGGDGTIANTGFNWYDGAVNYAIKNSIIKSTDFTNYSALATRAQMAYIFASILQPKDYTPINAITLLPDVRPSTLYSDHIYKLYNVGVIGGSDKMGTFKPSSNITRAETVAILKNLVVKSDRKVLSLSTPPTSGMLVSKERVKSLTTVYTGYPINSIGDANIYEQKESDGTILYRYVHLSPPEAIRTKYGEHIYGVTTQEQYDYVLKRIEDEKKAHNISTYDFANDRAWIKYYKVQTGTASELERKWIEQWDFVSIIQQFGEIKAKELYVQMGLTGRLDMTDYRVNTYKGVEYTLAGESAYEELTYGANCNGLAHLNSAGWDSYGYSTRILADTSHAWAQVRLPDGIWYNMDLGLGSQTTNTSPSKGTWVLVQPTY